MAQLIELRISKSGRWHALGNSGSALCRRSIALTDTSTTFDIEGPPGDPYVDWISKALCRTCIAHVTADRVAQLSSAADTPLEFEHLPEETPATAASLSTTDDTQLEVSRHHAEMAPPSTSKDARRRSGGRARVSMAKPWREATARPEVTGYLNEIERAVVMTDVEALADAVKARIDADRKIDDIVARLRKEGVSWSVIASKTGLTRAGAHKRWGTGA